MALSSETLIRADSARGSTDEHRTELVRRILLGELSPEQVCADEELTSEELTEWMRCYRRAARRAIDEQFAAALSAQGVDPDDFVLSGNLENVGLTDLLEAVRLGRKNAHIRIEHGGEYSHLWCADGEVIDAQAGSVAGDAAVYRLLALRQGRLQADFSSVVRERTVLASTEALLVDFARRLDEARLVRERMGDTSRICIPDPRQFGASAGLGPDELELLRAFDGTRSIAAVIGASRRPELETLDTVLRFLSEGRLIEASELDARSDRVAAGPSREPLVSFSGEPHRASQFSVPPVVPSLAASLAPPFLREATPLTRAALVAAAALPLVFGVGFWSARSPAPESALAVAAPAPSLEGVVDALCGPGMALFAPSAAAAAESPRAFCVSQRAVSTEEYQACVSGQRCEPARVENEAAEGQASAARSLRCNAGAPGRERHPINCVTHRQAEQYCEWRGQRLPSPREWELAWQASHGGAGTLVLGSAPPAGASELGAVSSEWTKGHVARTPPGVEPSADQQLYAVLGAGARATQGGRPSRLYMSASAHGRQVGFRCAASLEATAAPPEPESTGEASQLP